jgi:predicted nuclease of predicted toxin-antitoxin system
MLRLLIDESIDGNVVRGLLGRLAEPDIVRVQEVGLRTRDDQIILEWAAAQGRILVTQDRKTMITFARERIIAGLPMPGLLVLRPRLTIGAAIDVLAIAVECSEQEEWRNQVAFLP